MGTAHIDTAVTRQTDAAEAVRVGGSSSCRGGPPWSAVSVRRMPTHATRRVCALQLAGLTAVGLSR